MTKEQFIETLSGFVAPKLIETLVKHADNNGYFKDASVKSRHQFKLRKIDAKFGKVTPLGLRIDKKLYTFEKEYDMWKYLGQELLVKNGIVFDSAGRNLGKLILI